MLGNLDIASPPLPQFVKRPRHFVVLSARHRSGHCAPAPVGNHSVARVARGVSQAEASSMSSQCTEKAAASITDTFARLRSQGEVALIPFIVAGDPDLQTTEEALRLLVDAGCDVIELGVPYSDPLADGPVIQAAATRALSNGTTLQDVLQLLERVTPSLRAPIVLFTYFNPIMKRGAAQFMRDIEAAGARGLVVPDVPLEETHVLRELASQHGLELVLLTTPTTPHARMEAIAQATQGFLYLVSLTGVTGERRAVESRVQELLHDIKKATDKPVAVGFGISQPAHARQVVQWGADGVIVGSALVRLLAESPSREEGLQAVASLARSLKAACQGGGVDS